MKSLILLTVVLLSSVSFGQIRGLSFANLAGTYEATATGLPIKTTLTINVHGDITLVETSGGRSFHCTGKARLDNGIVSSSVVCTNDARFDQRINLSNISNLRNFQAPVYSSLFGTEVLHNFRRIR